MASAKIAVGLKNDTVKRLDRLVVEGVCSESEPCDPGGLEGTTLQAFARAIRQGMRKARVSTRLLPLNERGVLRVTSRCRATRHRGRIISSYVKGSN